MKGQAGYTLLELLVVLTIMGLLIAAVPAMALPGIQGARLSAKVEQITARLDAAHEEAIETGQAVIVHTQDLVTPGSAVDLVGRSQDFVFYPDGSADGTSITIELMGHRRSIMVDSITGNVHSSLFRAG